MNFDLSEEQRLIVETTRAFVENELYPHEMDIERSGVLDPDLVRELQKILNAEGFTVAESGAGSPGNETAYFGNLTKQALIRYQNFYAADILEPVGLSWGTGYFGPSTINFINR